MEPYHLIRLEGTLDVSRYPDFRSEFERAEPGVPVLVDLLGVEHVDSTFLSELLLLHRRHRGAMAVVIPPEGHVYRMFDIVNFASKMAVFTDVSEAIRSLGITPEKANDAERADPDADPGAAVSD